MEGKTPVASDFGFDSCSIPFRGDTIACYTYHKPGITPASIFMYLPGADAENIYTYHKENDSSYWFNSLIDFDFSYLPDDFLYVVVAKPGFGFCDDGKKIPQKYWEFTSLADRVDRADLAIKFIKKNIVRKPRQIAVFGYSEGFYVGSKLAVQNKNITHLGIGGGGGYIDFYDFIIENQKQVMRGELRADSAVYFNLKLVSDFAELIKNPAHATFTYGYSNKRWATFSEPPVSSLVKLTIPIFQIHAAEDKMTPVENAYIVPLEFARLKKQNLTFSICANCNHSLIETRDDGKEINHRQEIMNRFFEWVRSIFRFIGFRPAAYRFSFNQIVTISGF